jgi:Fe-S-cluster containining protein
MPDPQQRADSITARNGGEIARIMNETVPEILGAPGASRRYKYIRLVELAERAAALMAPDVTCRKGCAHCCRIPVAISAWEAGQLAKFTGRTAHPVPTPATREENIARFTGKPCPFLKDNLCTVYEVRPMVCRLFHSLEDDPELCDAGKHPGHSIRRLNDDPFVHAWGWLLGDERTGDIREFFPAA